MPKLVCALVLAVACAGWNQAAQVAKPAPAKTVTSPDAQIEHIIQQKFAKSKINADHFTVSVKGGVATITGSTNVMQHKGVATRLARSSGATVVKNQIVVSDAAKAKAAAQLKKATVVPSGGSAGHQ
ncbi:MAG TPA: BON domain-containing protein [Bryobacteraceae bacterium]|nr:BON domain-containing protein [Bryobacteraceae bacterium]